MMILIFTPAWGQTQDLAGIWHFTDEHETQIRIELYAQGNSWLGSSLSKLRAELKLNPSGLKNQWVGNLTTDEVHKVKAHWKAGKLVLTDLDDGMSWTFLREK